MGNNPGRITMFWSSFLSQLKNLGTIWGIIFGLAILALIFVKGLEWASIAYVKYVSLPTIRWPEITLPNVAWKQISEPARKATKMILIIVSLVACGVVVPLVLAFGLALHEGVADPVAYVTAGVFLSICCVSLGGLYLLIKQRNALREMGPYALLWCVVAISWLTSAITMLPLMFLSD